MRCAHLVLPTLTRVLFTLLLAKASLAFGDEPEVSNHIVAIIDGSITFRDRQAEAVRRVVTLLEAMAAQMAAQRVHRWENPAADRITIISLDAIPDVLWEGTARDLKTTDCSAWTRRFSARGDYANCTDLSAAFRLAARQLNDDPKYVDKYIFAFTDLIDEPPTTSLCTCRPPARPSLPAGDFPWEDLRGVSVAVLWVPQEQTLAWRRAVSEHGLESTFAVHVASESGDIAVTPPPRPVRVVTEAERTAIRERIVERVGGWARTVGIAVGALLVLLIVLCIAAAIARRSRRGNARPAAPITRIRLPQPRAPQEGAGPVRAINVRPAARPRPQQRSN